MKMADLYNKIFPGFILIISVCFFIGCGLDNYYYLDAPKSNGVKDPTSDDPLTAFFTFITNEEDVNNKNYIGGSSEFTFLGTDVYYKIYNDSSKLSSVSSTISSYLSETNSTVSTFEKIRDTYGYKPLKLSSGSYSTLFTAIGKNRFVYIRLTDYNNDINKSCICIDSASGIAGWNKEEYFEAANYGNDPDGNSIRPMRYINPEYSFNFGGTDSDHDLVPSKDDEDVTYTETSDSENIWYVDLYAVSTGFDTVTFEMSYSQVLHLGAVSIEEGQYSSKNRN